MKNTISEMKSILEGINRVDETKDWISNIEDRVAEDTQLEQQQKKKESKKMKIA